MFLFTLFFFFFFYLFGLWATSSSAQDLLFILCSGITPRGTQSAIYVLGSEDWIGVNCMQTSTSFLFYLFHTNINVLKLLLTMVPFCCSLLPSFLPSILLIRSLVSYYESPLQPSPCGPFGRSWDAQRRLFGLTGWKVWEKKCSHSLLLQFTQRQED